MTAPTPPQADFVPREDWARLVARLDRMTFKAEQMELERDQARQMLADAPHGWACDFNFLPGLDRVPDDAECSCWKAGL